MCGITGWLFAAGQAPDDQLLRRMADSIAHRGPDDEGFHVDRRAGAALAHRRLSIVDLSNASHQPMVDSTTRVTLAYNGELYNFKALRTELQGLGHRFHSSGDTEVMLRAYLQWGIACLDRFYGMFALAIWDPREQVMHLARDAMGMKPLYLLQSKSGVAFSSEVKAFKHLPEYSGKANAASLQQYLEFGYVFSAEQTMLQGVSKLEPGQRVVLRVGQQPTRVQWFQPPAPDLNDSRDEAERVEELRSTLEKVVAEHLVADVPVGLLLSGGLDSSLIAALAAKSVTPHTICMGFHQGDVDERRYANQVARHIGASHTDVLIGPDEIRQEIEQSAWVFDDLFADWGTMSTKVLYRKCREMGIKVVLVGEGADELFGGYEVFRQPPRLGLWQQFKLYQRYAGRRYGRLFGAFRETMAEYLASSNGDPFHAVQLFESRSQLPNQYVMKVDKASMSESVEARAPYLDRRVAELAFRTPAHWHLRNGQNKHLLRSLACQDNLLPPNIGLRAKYGSPLSSGWMENDAQFRSFARDMILSTGSQTRKLGLSAMMSEYFDQSRSGQRFPGSVSIYRNLAWRLLLLELWAPHYIDK